MRRASPCAAGCCATKGSWRGASARTAVVAALRIAASGLVGAPVVVLLPESWNSPSILRLNASWLRALLSRPGESMMNRCLIVARSLSRCERSLPIVVDR